MKIPVLHAGLACHRWLNSVCESHFPLRFSYIFSFKNHFIEVWLTYKKLSINRWMDKENVVYT